MNALLKELAPQSSSSPYVTPGRPLAGMAKCGAPLTSSSWFEECELLF